MLVKMWLLMRRMSRPEVGGSHRNVGHGSFEGLNKSLKKRMGVIGVAVNSHVEVVRECFGVRFANMY